ncbi:MAG TPA: MDR family MFS transporter [Lentibacillus sp.]|uniref:MDR family MFS transporter n=1 Tax=Lentibacillus sp. TaxID=1925746 RepID=UPI002B4B6750|nr:MDR family MFS transporter [Lentibacillus sp.]HLR63660.1 MDR family MFS transporter [Lentibacillus sp.]
MSENQENQQSLSQAKRTTLMLVLISGAFSAILNQTLLATALPKIMADMNLGESTAQWLTSIFMLVNGIMIPITALLINRFTTRGLFLTAMGLFGAGTIICAFAPNFPLLMVGRIVQASGAGIIMPLMQTILMLVYPLEKRGSAMGMFGLVIAFAPAIGPTLSGYLVEHFPWRSLFYVVFPIIVIDVVIAYFLLRNVTERTFPKVDVPSIILSTFGFGGLLFGFSVAGSAANGWGSPQVMISMVVGAVSLTFFIFRQLRLPQPILEFRIFKYKMFTLATVLGMVVFIAMIGAATVLPILMQNYLGFSALESGLALMPGAAIMGIMSPITGRLFDRFGAKYLAIIGLTIVTVTTFMLAVLTTETTFAYIATVNAVRMFGVAMVMMPITTAGLNELPNKMMPHGTAMNNTMRQVAGAVGTALLVTVMSNAAIPEEGRQGLVHGSNVSFVVAGVIAVIGIVLAFFVKNPRHHNRNAV